MAQDLYPTKVKVPAFLRKLPVYPSKEQRRADEVRTIIATSSNDALKNSIVSTATDFVANAMKFCLNDHLRKPLIELNTYIITTYGPPPKNA